MAAWVSWPVSSIARGICRGFGLRIRRHSLENPKCSGLLAEGHSNEKMKAVDYGYLNLALATLAFLAAVSSIYLPANSARYSLFKIRANTFILLKDFSVFSCIIIPTLIP